MAAASGDARAARAIRVRARGGAGRDRERRRPFPRDRPRRRRRPGHRRLLRLACRGGRQPLRLRLPCRRRAGSLSGCAFRAGGTGGLPGCTFRAGGTGGLSGCAGPRSPAGLAPSRRDPAGLGAPGRQPFAETGTRRARRSTSPTRSPSASALGLGERGHADCIHFNGNHLVHLDDLLRRARGKREEIGLGLRGRRGPQAPSPADQPPRPRSTSRATSRCMRASAGARSTRSSPTNEPPIPDRRPAKTQEAPRRRSASPSGSVVAAPRPGGPRLHFFDDDRRASRRPMLSRNFFLHSYT